MIRERCDGCSEMFHGTYLTPVDRTGGPDGDFCTECLTDINAPDCTCYELTGGHMPGCAFNRAAP